MADKTHALAALFLFATAACAVASETGRAGDVVSSSSSFVTSTSVPFEIDYSFRIGIYPTAPIRSLQIKLIWAGGWTSGFYCSLPAVGTTPESTTTSTIDEIDLSFDFGSAGLQQSQSLLKCSVDAWHAEAYFSPEITFVDARGLDNQPVDVTTRLCLDCGKSRPPDYGGTAASNYDTCGANLCGDVVVDGVYNTSDAQLLLKTAVGTLPAFPQRYDVDRDSRIVAIDALRVLRHAVGLPSTLFCAPPPLAECDVVQPPVTSTTTPAPSDVSGH